ncbi:hypothetical protein B0A50_05242 [Salinomyces thailandicus]|uniref:Uncharacterized protein n=1 Tax=Salinomyces thailandicus TaxID=706561 RepID=A0A4U0TX57_9PEZI|nr:hypothetical protein B0A50_05242 [Salinomyces thailandica]
MEIVIPPRHLATVFATIAVSSMICIAGGPRIRSDAGVGLAIAFTALSSFTTCCSNIGLLLAESVVRHGGALADVLCEAPLQVLQSFVVIVKAELTETMNIGKLALQCLKLISKMGVRIIAR